jgi:hypothetical protein
MHRSLLIVSLLTACTTTTSNLDTATSPSALPGYADGYERVFTASVDAIAMLSWEITVAEMDAGVIVAKTPRNLLTWGDKVTVKVFRPDSLRADTLTRVGFTSGTDQAIDWGKNSANQKKFFQKLDLILNAKQP